MCIRDRDESNLTATNEYLGDDEYGEDGLPVAESLRALFDQVTALILSLIHI